MARAAVRSRAELDRDVEVLGPEDRLRRALRPRSPSAASRSRTSVAEPRTSRPAPRLLPASTSERARAARRPSVSRTSSVALDPDLVCRPLPLEGRRPEPARRRLRARSRCPACAPVRPPPRRPGAGRRPWLAKPSGSGERGELTRAESPIAAAYERMNALPGVDEAVPRRGRRARRRRASVAAISAAGLGRVDHVVELEQRRRVERLGVLFGGGGELADALLALGLVGDRLELLAQRRAAPRPRGPSARGGRVGQATVSSGSCRLPPAIAWAPRP